MLDFLKKKAAGPRTIYPDFDKFVREGVTKMEWTRGTEIRWGTFKGHLLKFDDALTYDFFTEDGMDEFVEYLIDDLHLRNSTVGKELRLLRWFLRWAEQKGYNNLRDYSFYKPRLKNVKNSLVFLLPDELERLYRFDIPESCRNFTYLSEARDMFCLCCFTSLRYSDMINLKVRDIKENKIIVTTQKTSQTLSIELNEYASEILDRYSYGKRSDEYVMPRLSNPKMNQCLKALGQICDISTPVTKTYFRGRERVEITVPKWQCLSTHCARRTFICTALSSGVNAHTVMKWTGHSNYNSMAPYIDVSDTDKERSMRKIFTALQCA